MVNITVGENFRSLGFIYCPNVFFLQRLRALPVMFKALLLCSRVCGGMENHVGRGKYPVYFSKAVFKHG